MKTLHKHTKAALMVFMLLTLNLAYGQQSNYVGKAPLSPNFNTGKTGDILFDQMYNPGSSFMVSHHFTSSTNNTKTSACADDFDVPVGESWDVHSLGVIGTWWQDAAGGGDTLNVYFMSDNNGKPGDTLYAFPAHSELTLEEEIINGYIQTHFEVVFPSTLNFTEGTYWVSVQMYSDFDITGQWGWNDHIFETNIYGAEWHWINPKDGFGFGATDWTPASVVVGPWLSWELSFALYGTPPDDDLSVLEITAPEDYYYGPPTEEKEVRVKIKNEGSNPQTGFDISYNFDGTIVTENIGSITLDYNETYEYSFTETVDLSTPGNYDLSIYTELSGDERPDNNEQSMNIIVFDPTVYLMPSNAIESITVCSGTFADAGGIDGNCIVDDYGIFTIYPATAGAKIRLDFIQFDIDWSDFWIYDGEDIYATELGWWENDISPGTITASYGNTSGALTIRFQAQGWTPFEAPGWAANIICHTPAADDFEVMKIELSHPSIFENDYVTAYASIKNLGTTILEKDVTFTANGITYATVSTGMVSQSDTVIVEAIWNPTLTDDYILEASIPDDGYNSNNSANMSQHVYLFDYFYEGFEFETFPPDGWSQSGNAWTRHTYQPAVGEGHAYLWVEYGLFDTLYSPKLHIEAGDKLSFLAFSSPWWPGELELVWIDGETGVTESIENIPIPYVNYAAFEVDVSAAAGNNYLGFVGKYNPMGGQGEVKIDEVMGIGLTRHFYEKDLKAYTLGGDITPEENVPTSLELEIKNIGSQIQSGADYTIRLMQEPDIELMSYPGQDINPKEVLDLSLDFTFPYAGLYNCYVVIDFADDEDQSNNTSSPLNVYVQQEGTVQVYIGENNDYESNWVHPITISTTGLYSQTLYTTEDVGEANTITGIMYYYKLQANYPIYDNPITIWMSETVEVNMADSLEAANNYDLVFEGTFDAYPGYHGVYIPLDFVYSYQGGNLMVTTYKDFNQGNWAEFYVGTTHVADTMVRYFNGYENDDPYNPYDQSSIDSLYLFQKMEYANVKFFKFNLDGQYCTPVVLNGTSAGDYIDGVSFNEIENLGTGSQGGPAYNNYTSISTNVERGRSYELTIHSETSGSEGSIAAWIDFNGNNQLDDEGERIVHISSNEASQEITYLVTIPDDAAIGLTILRIRNSSEADLFASCQAVDYGETEDYGVNIIETIQVYNPALNFSVELNDVIVDMVWDVPENIGIAHTEGFEMSAWPPQNGWEVKQSTSLSDPLTDPTGETWAQYDEDMQFVYNGAFSALCPPSAMDFNWLITPEVQLYGNDEISFMLNYSADASGYSKFYVMVYSDEEWNAVLEYTDETTMFNNFDERVTVSLGDYAGKIVKIAFVSEYNNAYAIAIDDAILNGMAADKSVSGITGYDIYRNGELLNSISDVSVIEFSDELSETEHYEYCIFAMYDDGEKSAEACDGVFYLAPLTAPLNVLASAIDNDVTVSWVAPNAGMQRFGDDFEDYTVNQQVACQNPDDWTTWTLDPCGSSDPYISDEQAYSGDHSVVNEGVSDLLFLTDDLLEEGKYSFNFRMYIPSGHTGYFNVLQDHDLTIGALWGMQAFFDEDGIGTLDGGGYGSATFLFEYDRWMYIEVIVNLDADWGEFLIEGDLIHEWQWSTGISGGGGWNTFEGADFYAWNNNLPAKYFVDDVQLTQIYDATDMLDYNIYKDGSFYSTATGVSFDDPDVTPGIHDYCVSAVYDEGESAQLCDYVLILTAPQNMTATIVAETNVLCVWEEINSSDLIGYNLFKDGELLEENITETDFLDEDVVGGTHTYYVTAVYTGGESIPSNIAEVSLILAPSNLLANADEDGNILLEWEGVGVEPAGDLFELYQHDGIPANGLYQWFDFGYGVVYDLEGYTETSLEMVDFHHSSYGVTGTWSYMIHVVDWSTFTELAEFGPFQTTGNDIWEMEIPLESLVPSSYLVGIFLEPMSNDPQDAYPILSCDIELDGVSFEASTEDYTLNNPAPGDFLMNLWIEADETKAPVKARKFMMNNLEITNAREAYLPVPGELSMKQQTKGTKDLMGYNVFYSFNSGAFSNIALATDTTFIHEGAAVEGLHTYYITATYDEGESDPSNEASVLLSGVDEVELGGLNIYPNPVNNELNIITNETMTRVLVINAKGQIVIDEKTFNTNSYRINTSDLQSGIYNVRIETAEGWINKKVVKK